MSAFLDDLFSRRVLWVTGKGGTGKSTISAALAVLAAQRNLRTLLIDVEASGDAARFLDAAPPRYEAKQARPNLFHLALHPEEVLDEYLHVALKLPRVRRIGPLRRVFDFVATAAPGIKEVLIAGKVGFEERAQERGAARWDLIVIDAAPSGQVVSHLRGPRTIQEMVGVGMIRNQTAWVRDILEDPKRTGVVVVSLAEEMPVSETAELLESIPKAVPTPVLGIVANRIVDLHPDKGDPNGYDGSVPVGRAALNLVAGLARNQKPYLERLTTLGPPAAVVPLLGIERHDAAATERIASSLAESTG